MVFNLIEQNIFFIIFFVLIFLVAAVCVDILRLLRKERKERKEIREIPRRTDLQPPKPYSANDISLMTSEKFKKQLEESVEEEIKKNITNLRNNFERTSEEIIKNYRSQFKDGEQEIQKVVSETSQQAAEEIKKVSEVLSNELAQKFGGIYQSAKGILNNKVTETEKEIDNYKRQRFEEINRKMYQLLAKIAKETIGKAMDLSDHEKLVMEALEKAKKEIF